MKRWIWFHLVLLVLALVILAVIFVPTSFANYDLSLEADKRTVEVGEEVVLTATLKNLAFTYDVPVFDAMFIDIRREDEEPPIIVQVAVSIPFFPLQERSVSETYTFSEPGVYVMKAYCPMMLGSQEMTHQLEASLVIVVTP